MPVEQLVQRLCDLKQSTSGFSFGASPVSCSRVLQQQATHSLAASDRSVCPSSTPAGTDTTASSSTCRIPRATMVAGARRALAQTTRLPNRSSSRRSRQTTTSTSRRPSPSPSRSSPRPWTRPCSHLTDVRCAPLSSWTPRRLICLSMNSGVFNSHTRERQVRPQGGLYRHHPKAPRRRRSRQEGRGRNRQQRQLLVSVQ